MKNQRPFTMINIEPNPSSQTTTSWPITRIEENIIVAQSIGYDISGPQITPVQEKTWNEFSQEVMTEYEEAWEKLSNL